MSMEVVKARWRALKSMRQAAPWIGFTVVIGVCAWIIHGGAKISGSCGPWIVVIAKLVAVGASTALFTRFLGGMGMFRDAISDVMTEDAWIDKRNDLEIIWGKITQRIFLPGFTNKAPEAEQLIRVRLRMPIDG